VIWNDGFELNPAAKATHVMEIRNEMRSIVDSFRCDGSGNK
jgi:hypothetical protein